MTSTPTIDRAPPDFGSLILGRTLPSLLYEACDRYPNHTALNQWQKRHWQAQSNIDLRTAAEEFGLGILTLGLHQGDRVAFVMHSDISFCIADMGCLLAGLVDVPIDLTQTIENILFILEHTAARVLVISNLGLFTQISPYLSQVSTLQTVIVADPGKKVGDGAETVPPPEECLQIPHLLGDDHLKHQSLEWQSETPTPSLPQSLRVLTMADIRDRGRNGWSLETVQQLQGAIAPTDLATILYIASETKRPRGVMLTHESIAANVLAAFSSYPNLETGDREVALIFLPLTHIFARVFLYGHLAYGHSIYFSDPNHVVRHLKTVNPTIMITVPRLLEKVYERLLDQEHHLGKFDGAVFRWALKLAQRYEVGQVPQKLYALQLKLADRLVFAKWRSLFGNRLKALICGGAALRADITNVFTAAGIPVLQGYGLTETSAVLCYNRGTYNRAGTVGVPIAGVEIAIAPDGEILIKSPFVMRGYYRDEVATQQILTPDGWLRTGDLGERSDDGFLTITGVKKPLFKLSTGKYVSSLLLEAELGQSPLVAQAIAVGANHKFCGMLIVPDLAQLQMAIQAMDIDVTSDQTTHFTVDFWLQHPCVLALYQSLIDMANCHLPYWSTVRKFKLVNVEFTLENGLLNADGTVNRLAVLETFAADIALLYAHAAETQGAGELGRGGTAMLSRLTSTPLSSSSPPACPMVTADTCPTYARSLTQH